MEKRVIAVIRHQPTTTTLAALFGKKEEIEEAVDLDNLINKKEGVSTMSNYNEDILEQRIALKTAENSRMLDVSMFNAKNDSKPII